MRLLLFQKRPTKGVLRKEKHHEQTFRSLRATIRSRRNGRSCQLDAARRSPIALLRVLAHNPRMLSRFRGGRLLDPGILPMRERELLILWVSRLCGCEYEWSIHAVVFAGDAGLKEADLRATLRASASEPLSPRECLMLTAAGELVIGQRLAAVTAVDLRLELEPVEIVELIAFVGRYIWVAMIANAAELPPEPSARRWSTFAD